MLPAPHLRRRAARDASRVDTARFIEIVALLDHPSEGLRATGCGGLRPVRLGPTPWLNMCAHAGRSNGGKSDLSNLEIY